VTVRERCDPATGRVKVAPATFRSLRHRLRRMPRAFAGRSIALLVLAVVVLDGCQAGPPSATPPVVAGDPGAPREVNLIAKDYSFLPDVLDLVPGETILLHVINGGLEIHEAIGFLRRGELAPV